MAGTIVIGICFGIVLLIFLPLYFTKKNDAAADQEEFEEYLLELKALNTKYMPHLRKLSANLNTINYWLKTGRDPSDDAKDAEKAKNESRFYEGLMDKAEAKQWEAAVKMAKKKKSTANEDVKALRIPEFELKGLDGIKLGQKEMKFFYSKEYGDIIYYCVTPQYIKKGRFKNVLFFTTARPTNIPMTFPYKYEGAQMLSLYKHPVQALWFIANWKRIREGLEGTSPEVAELDETLAEFDL